MAFLERGEDVGNYNGFKHYAIIIGQSIMKKYLLLFLILVGNSVTSFAFSLEEQVNNIESSNKSASKEISNIFYEYKKIIKITTGEPKVIKSNGRKVTILMDVFIELVDPNNSLKKILHTLGSNINQVERRADYSGKESHIEVSWIRGGNRGAWKQLTKHGLLAEITFLNSKKLVPLYGNFSYSSLTTVHIKEKDTFEIEFIVDKSNLKMNPTPKIKLITKTCGKKGSYYSCKW